METLQKLRRAGWSVVRVDGSHHMLQHPTNPVTLDVPVHGSEIMALGTLGSIIRAAGLTVDEFIRL